MERNLFFDFCKGLLIFFVVLGHVLAYYSPEKTNHVLFLWISSFHMPCFFFISGIFAVSSLSNGYKDCLLKKTRRLLLPSFVWTFLSFLLFVILGEYTSPDIRDFYMEMRKHWFLFALFAFFVIAKLFFLCNKPYIYYFLIMVTFIATYNIIPIDILKHFHVVDYWPSFFAGIASSQFSGGGIISNKHFSTIVKLLCLSLLIYVLWTIGMLTDYDRWRFSNQKYVLRMVVYLSSILVYLSLFQVLISFLENKVVNIIIKVGRNTMVIYCTNEIFLRAIKVQTSNIMLLLIISILITYSGYVLSLILRKNVCTCKYLLGEN